MEKCFVIHWHKNLGSGWIYNGSCRLNSLHVYYMPNWGSNSVNLWHIHLIRLYYNNKHYGYIVLSWVHNKFVCCSVSEHRHTQTLQLGCVIY